MRTRFGVLAGLTAMLAGLVTLVAPGASAATPHQTHLCGPDITTRDTVLELTFTTGGDDLRGGNDNLNVTVVPRWHAPVTVPNVNRSVGWPGGSVRTVWICLTRFEIQPEEITGFTLTTTFGGGISGDNWNLDVLEANYRSWGVFGQESRPLTFQSGRPLWRFTGDAKSFAARVNPVFDGGFEGQTSRSIGFPWWTEGSDWKGVDSNLGTGQTGANNAFTWSTGRNWNAILQAVPVRPNTNYVLTGWVRTSGNVNAGFFGARLPGQWPPRESQFGATGAGYQRIEVRFNSAGSSSITVFGGLWGNGTPGGDWLQLDNVELRVA
jgi:hypothetical protein